MRTLNMFSALPNDRTTSTHELPAFRFRASVHQPQAFPVSRPFIQIITMRIFAGLLRHELFLRAITQRQRLRRHFVIIAFHHRTTKIPRRANHMTTPRPGRHRNRVRPPRRTDQILDTFMSGFLTHDITRRHTRELPNTKTPRTIHHRLKTLNPETRRRKRHKRPATHTTRKHIRVLTLSRERPECRLRPQQKLIPCRRREPSVEVFAEALLFGDSKHIFSIPLIRRRQQLIPTPIRQPNPRRRQSYKQPWRPSCRANSVFRHKPETILSIRSQTTNLLHNTHITITRTDINPRRNPNHTPHPRIFKPITRINTIRVHFTPKIRKRRRHTFNKYSTHRRHSRRRKRFSFAFLHTTMFTRRRFTRRRFSNNAIAINPPRHQTTNPDFSVHRVIFFLQPHFHRNRPSKHTRNIIPRITRLQRRKPTLLFRHTRIKHFFTDILKITPRHNKIFMHIIFSTTHLPIQHNSLLWFRRRLLSRHRAGIKPTLTKHIHHKLFTFDFMHSFAIYFHLDFIRGRIQIPSRADSNTAFRIISPELVTL